MNYGCILGWSPSLASEVSGQMGYMYWYVFFRSMALDWYSEVVAPPTTLCTMGVTWPSQRYLGNDGLKSNVLVGQLPFLFPYQWHLDTWTLDTWNIGPLDTWFRWYLESRITWNVATLVHGRLDIFLHLDMWVLDTFYWDLLVTGSRMDTWMIIQHVTKIFDGTSNTW